METNYDNVMLPKMDNSVRWICGIGTILSVLIMFFCVVGVYQIIWGIPGKKDNMRDLQFQSDIWRDRAIKAEAEIEEYKVAMNLEKLFLLIAKPDTITLLGDLEKELCAKAQFCLEKPVPEAAATFIIK